MLQPSASSKAPSVGVDDIVEDIIEAVLHGEEDSYAKAVTGKAPAYTRPTERVRRGRPPTPKRTLNVVGAKHEDAQREVVLYVPALHERDRCDICNRGWQLCTVVARGGVETNDLRFAVLCEACRTRLRRQVRTLDECLADLRAKAETNAQEAARVFG